MNSIIKTSNVLLRNTLNKRQLFKTTTTTTGVLSNNRYYSKFNNNNNSNNNNSNNRSKEYMTIGLVTGLSLIVPSSFLFCLECFEEDDEFITQIKTGFKFPKVLNSEFPFTIVNIGNRKLSFLNIDVYSIGFYINKDNAKSGLLDHSEKNRVDFCNTKDIVLQDILKKDIGVSLRIRPTRKVTWSHIYGGFQRSLVIMLLKKYDMPLDEISILMDELKSTMRNTLEISTTESIDFVKKDNNNSSVTTDNNGSPSLVILLNGKQVKEIKDPRLANCFFDFYLGENTKVSEARNQFYENLWLMFNHDKLNKSNHNIHATTISPI